MTAKRYHFRKGDIVCLKKLGRTFGGGTYGERGTVVGVIHPRISPSGYIRIRWENDRALTEPSGHRPKELNFLTEESGA